VNSRETAYFLGYLKKCISLKSIQLKKQRSIKYEREQEIKKIYSNYFYSTKIYKHDCYFENNMDIREVFEKKYYYEKLINLTEKQKQILEYIFMNNLTEREVAKKLNTTYQNINKIKKQALKKLI
jgi:DNA-directed RNA polymerase specialized sigma subunit